MVIIAETAAQRQIIPSTREAAKLLETSIKGPFVARLFALKVPTLGPHFARSH
jgi:hypothetical protein